MFSGILASAGCGLSGEIVGAGPPAEEPPDPSFPDAGTAPAPPSPQVPDAGTPISDPADAGGPPAPLSECTQKPSIDRLEQWLASGEGQTVPATGSLLVPEGDHYVARVQLVGSDWHVIVVFVGNQFEAQEDFSHASGFTLTYSASDDLYVQLRPGSHWDGGDKYVTFIPSTGGQVQTRTFSFDPSAWTSLPELGEPTYPFADAIQEVRGLVFISKTPGTLELRGLRVDGFTPTCL